MKFSVITPNFNGERFLEETLRSVLSQRMEGVDLEYIVIDGGSTDGSLAIIEKYRSEISHLVVERDTGPANAINKGFALATGDVVAWLNADDLYQPGCLKRVEKCLADDGSAAFCFGGCPIIDANGGEIRRGITSFKAAFFPFSSRFLHQSINYISQPALFFRRSAREKAGLLREDMVAAWDYEFTLRLWKEGEGRYIPGAPLAAFRWYEGSISGKNFSVQFKEEFEAARNDAGLLSSATILHYGVRWGIVSIYYGMLCMRKLRGL
ncbi:MAG: glycosyltransferase [Desulfobulbaceae bacterium]|nr:MAG: glycosyltransferase [Desulfobulbaceae bacterium]